MAILLPLVGCRGATRERAVTTPQPAVEEQRWRSTVRANRAADYEHFLHEFPASRHAGEARTRLLGHVKHAADAALDPTGLVSFAGRFPGTPESEAATRRAAQLRSWAALDRGRAKIIAEADAVIRFQKVTARAVRSAKRIRYDRGKVSGYDTVDVPEGTLDVFLQAEVEGLTPSSRGDEVWARLGIARRGEPPERLAGGQSCGDTTCTVRVGGEIVAPSADDLVLHYGDRPLVPLATILAR